MRTMIKKVKNVAQYEIWMLLFSVKFWMLLAMAWIFMDFCISELRRFAESYDLTMPPVAITFYYADSTFGNIGFVLLVFMLSDLPFRNNNQIFLLQRCGRRALCMGQLAAMCFISFFFTAAQILISGLLTYRCLGFDGWGKVWGSFADSLALDMGYSMPVHVGQAVLSNYTAGGALGASFLLISLMGICYGMIIYLLNNIGGGKAGTITMSVWSLLWLLLDNMSGYNWVRYVMKYSLQSWLSLEYTKPGQLFGKVVQILCVILVLFVINIMVEEKYEK